LKAQFAEERTKWDEANKQNMREHESLRNQKPTPPPAGQGKPAPSSPAKPAPPQTQFPFTSDPPEQGKMPAGGVIAHEKEQKALKQEIARLREPQARSDREVAKLRAHLAHTHQAFESLQKRNSVPATFGSSRLLQNLWARSFPRGLVF
jgi:hypothetical protein